MFPDFRAAWRVTGPPAFFRRGAGGTALLLACVAQLSASPVAAVQILLEPVKDTTLIEDNVDYSNGSGPFLFIGSIASGSPRRALLQFDLSVVPAGSTITSATLRLVISKAGAGSGFDQATLHRVAGQWSEGSSASNGGQGSQASAADATWAYRVYGNPGQGLPRVPWNAGGGDFDPAISTSTTLGSVGVYTFPTTPRLVADLQDWLNDPVRNFGWIVRGNEVQQKTARRLVGRSSGSTPDRPRLTIEYEPPSVAVPVLPVWGVIALAGGLLAIAVATLRGRK